MIRSSEKANRKAADVVEFAAKHRWAKYPCLAAVSAIYSGEYIRIKLTEIGEKLRESSQAPFRPLGSRIAAAFLSGSFALMIMPFSSITAYADEMPEQQVQTTAEDADAESDGDVELPKVRKAPAITDEDIAEMVTLEGLAESSSDYGIKLNIRTLSKNVTARFSESSGYLKQVEDAFSGYGIPTDNLDINPVDVTLYGTESKYILQLSEGYSADITLPIPENMRGKDDLRVIRLEDDGSITIIDGVIKNKAEGDTISFNTDHFSVFALVAYKTPARSENISSGAGMTATGVQADISISTGSNIFEEDKRRFAKNKKRKIYRIKRIAKERDLLLI